FSFLFNDTILIDFYSLSLHDALPISAPDATCRRWFPVTRHPPGPTTHQSNLQWLPHILLRRLYIPVCVSHYFQWSYSHTDKRLRSEEHTSELQSRENLVCRLLLEKKK